MKKLLTVLLVVGSMVVPSSVHAQDYQKGVQAIIANDYPTAMKEFFPLAEAGDVRAQYSLGAMFGDILDVNRDYKKALVWILKAAEQGHPAAQQRLGLMYEYGEGVIQDKVYAHMWYNIGASNGSTSGSKWRDEITLKMSAADISKAQELARECVKKQYKAC